MCPNRNEKKKIDEAKISLMITVYLLGLYYNNIQEHLLETKEKAVACIDLLNISAILDSRITANNPIIRKEILQDLPGHPLRRPHKKWRTARYHETRNRLIGRPPNHREEERVKVAWTHVTGTQTPSTSILQWNTLGKRGERRQKKMGWQCHWVNWEIIHRDSDIATEPYRGSWSGTHLCSDPPTTLDHGSDDEDNNISNHGNNNST